MAEIKYLDINSGHQLKAESVVQFTRKGEPQEIGGGVAGEAKLAL